MNNLAKKLDHADLFQEMATVVRVDGRVFSVRTESGDHQVRRAMSCLVEPELYDLVLVARAFASPHANAAGYILAVLEREEGASARIGVDGDLEIRLPHGRFAVAAQEGVEIAAGREVSIAAHAVNVRADEGSVVLQSLSYLGTQLLAEVAKVKVLAGTLDSVLDRLTLKVKRSYRSYEEFDHVKAQRLDYTAEKSMNLHGQTTTVTADELVKVDGEQIHIG